MTRRHHFYTYRFDLDLRLIGEISFPLVFILSTKYETYTEEGRYEFVSKKNRTHIFIRIVFLSSNIFRNLCVRVRICGGGEQNNKCRKFNQ